MIKSWNAENVEASQRDVSVVCPWTGWISLPFPSDLSSALCSRFDPTERLGNASKEPRGP